MTGLRPLARGVAVLALAGLAAAGQAPAALAARACPRPPVRPAPAAGWQVRTVLPESRLERSLLGSQVLGPGFGVVYSLVPVNGEAVRFQLRRTRLASRATAAGPVFRVSRLWLASGFLWVSGEVLIGPHGGLRAVLHQVSTGSLRVIRSWTLAPTRSLDEGTAVAPGPGLTVWAGFQRTLRLISMTSGATLRRVTLPAGFAVSGLATDPRRRHLYAGAESGSGRGGVFEYLAGTGAPVASGTSPPVEFAVSGPWLTAVPGAVWASFRTGMKGATVLLRQRDLATVPLHRPIFGWDMFATTVYGGGALWLATMDGVIGCIGPRSGAVRARAALRALRASGRLLRVDPDRHLVYGVGQRGVVAITPPLSCWA